MSKLRDSEEASVARGREWPRWRWRGDEAAGVLKCSHFRIILRRYAEALRDGHAAAKRTGNTPFFLLRREQ